ncbi:fibronectin type III domain-containing protein, partial [Streptomyces rhizosphaericus]|uniref:fibronectin type III domain-containing protein n=1 Tax=Streptomyces rhizosphaericus TaxID=114699 RepID=UPI0031DD8B63
MKTPRGWEQVATAPQSTVGGAKFLVPTEAVGSFDFRAMTAPFNGASAVTTAPRTLEVTATPPTDITPPAVPTGVVATPGNGHVGLAWSPVTASDLDGYLVYRAPTANGPWAKLTAIPNTATGYDATGLTNGTTYWFAITSIDDTGNESARSNASPATPASPPSSVVDHCGTLSVDQTWTPATTHRLTCDLTVPAGRTLTVEAGAVIK